LEINLGVEFFHKKDYDNVIKCFGKTLEINPRNRKAWKNLCVAYLRENVNEDFKYLKPNNGYSWYNLSKALYQKKCYKEALDVINTSLELNPAYDRAFDLRDKIQRKLDLKEDGKNLKTSSKKEEKDPLDEKFRKFQKKFQAWKKERELGKLSRKDQKDLSLDERYRKVKESVKQILQESKNIEENAEEKLYKKNVEVEGSKFIVESNEILINGELYNPTETLFVIDGANVAYTVINEKEQAKLENIELLKRN
jgi:tetratricopeptide (TPR) repeat protein